MDELKLKFSQHVHLPKDLKGIILSYLPYTYKDYLIGSIYDNPDTNSHRGFDAPMRRGTINFVEEHIHHQEPHGIWEEYDRKTKRILLDKQYVNGILNGIYREYWENGIVYKEKKYVNGVMDGVFWTYFENGVLNMELAYEHGEKIGYHKIWYPNGQLKEVFITPYGGLREMTEYYEDGNRKLYRIYYNGKWGHPKICQSWHSNGNMESQWYYNEDGEFHGICRNWYSNGQMESERKYYHGYLNGLSRVWRNDGKLLEEKKFQCSFF